MDNCSVNSTAFIFQHIEEFEQCLVKSSFGQKKRDITFEMCYTPQETS